MFDPRANRSSLPVNDLPRLPPRRPDRGGLYVHFPFCIQKCDYCDFYSLALERGRTVSPDFLIAFRKALAVELAGRLEAFRARGPLNTVYFGGGTSSLLPADWIADFLDLVRSYGLLSPNGDEIEITLEGNPENFTPATLDGLALAGVTRVNTGIQTFQGRALESMNRFFDPERYASVLGDLDASRIPHVGADLIYGLPGQSEEDFFGDLERLLATRVDHIALYSLTVEAGTPYAKKVQAGGSAPDEDAQERVFAALPDLLRARGLFQYEISNYARPGATCRHNLRYWYYESYMGLGPGAHGFDGRMRYGNPRNLEKWLVNPLGAALEPHDPLADIALNLLRLTLPVPRDFVRAIWAERAELDPGERERLAGLFLEQMDRWVQAGLADRTGPDGAEFLWRPAGQMLLDERVYEMNTFLESGR